MLGEFSTIPKASDVARRDVATCQLNEQLGEVHRRCQAAGWKVCLVVNDSNVVLGRLRGKAWEADPDANVGDVMENGPTTFRPDKFLAPLIKRMIEKKVGTVVITNPDGVLVGLLYRKDGEQRLEREQAEKESNAGLSKDG
jgi:predicted transcriptional regulator